ncbi:MAG: ROK family protein [Anaerolineae bacterium]
MNKVTRADFKRHNRRLVMRALFEDVADNRAALAVETGLTKPTIGNIVRELLDMGYVTEDGFGTSSSSGGKRPTILRFMPRARQVIGVSVKRDEIIAGLSYLDGTIIARHHNYIAQGDNVIQAIEHTINALIVQKDAQLLCIAIGVPGIVSDDHSTVIRSRSLEWENVSLATRISERYDLPCYIDNNTALITRMQFKQSEQAPNQLVMVAVDETIEIGSTFGGDVYQHGGDIDDLVVPTTGDTLGTLRTPELATLMPTIDDKNPQSVLTQHANDLLMLRRAVLLEYAEAITLQTRIAHNLAYLYRWIIGLMRPSEIVLTGTLSALGQRLLDETAHILSAQSHTLTTHNVQLTLAQSNYLRMQGAVVFAIQEELGIL